MAAKMPIGLPQCKLYLHCTVEQKSAEYPGPTQTRAGEYEVMRLLAVFALIVTLSSGPGLAAPPDEAIEASGVPGGLAVWIGCDHAESLADSELGKSFLIQVVDTDRAKVRKTRESFSARGIHGRITAAAFDGRHLPYVDGLVNLLILPNADVSAEASAKAGFRLPNGELERVLAPRGVVVDASDGVRVTFRKPFPADMDSWPHWLHGPDNNAVSRDERVGISRGLQWTMPPAWGRHHNMLHSINAMVSENGRLYYIMDHAPVGIQGPTAQWALACRDAFNGLDLWKRPIVNWGWQKWSEVGAGGTMRFRGPDQLFRRLVAAGDRVYVTLGFNEPVTALDGRTGKTIREYEGTEDTATIQTQNDTLYLTRNVLGERAGKTIMAVAAETGKILWERSGYRGITPEGNELKRFTDAHLTVGEKRVFFIDREEIVALEIKTGKDAWRTRRPEGDDVFGHYAFNFRNYCSLVYQDGKLFLGQIHTDKRNLNQWQVKDMAVWALDATTGKKLWEHTGASLSHFTPPDLFINRGRVWTMDKASISLLGLDMNTGEVVKNYPVKDMLVGHHHRCYRNKATVNWYLAGEEGIEFINFGTGELDVQHWLRGACAYGIMPANGLIYLPAHACGCHGNAKLNGFMALAPVTFESRGVKGVKGGRLEEGPAYSTPIRQPAFVKATADKSATGNVVDWPTYKHDNRRGNATSSPAPGALSEKWRVSIGGRITAPVIAAGRAYLAARDRHEVHCLSAETGKALWRFVADGRIDSPPTYHGGRLFFGTRSGSVYSLAADKGTLAWRFRAAPSTDKLVGYGQLESVWPVNGTVLVRGNKVYCVAGRSMNLDGGIFAYVLDVESGKVLQQARYEADPESKGETKDSVLAGILVDSDDGIFMRNMLMDPDDIRKTSFPKAGPVLIPNAGGLLDSSWYNSAFWKYTGASAQMLVHDDRLLVGLAAYRKQTQKSYPHDVPSVGSGYQLFAMRLKGEERARGQARKPEKTKEKTKAAKGKGASRKLWQETIPVRAEALILTDRAVCLAGPPDVVDKEDAWAAFENRKGGILQVRSKTDGRKLHEAELGSAPVYDGMAAAAGRLFVSLKDGSLVCF